MERQLPSENLSDWLEIVQRIEPVLNADCDVADEEPLELIQTILERFCLGSDVVLEALARTQSPS